MTLLSCWVLLAMSAWGTGVGRAIPTMVSAGDTSTSRTLRSMVNVTKDSR
jgi:hypothetical protein